MNIGFVIGRGGMSITLVTQFDVALTQAVENLCRLMNYFLILKIISVFSGSKLCQM